jgi:hypothetical protein
MEKIMSTEQCKDVNNLIHLSSLAVDRQDKGDDRNIFSIDHDYALPTLQTVAVALNANAAICASIATVIITIMNQHNYLNSIVSMSKLILCFIVGSAVSLISLLLDFTARAAYKREASKPSAFSKCASIFDYLAVGVMLASITVFGWGLWESFFSFRDSFA